MKKQSDLIVLGLAAVAVYMIAKSQKSTTTASSGLRGTAATVSEVLDSAGKAFANGWRYFTDGTSIDPQGNYYSGGQLVWSNQSATEYV